MFVVNLTNQFLPLTPRFFRNSGKMPSAPAALPFLTAFKAMSTSLLVKILNISDESLHEESSLASSFLISNFSCFFCLIL
jgi:hypothetical protein